MSESTLAITLTSLQNAVSRYLGYGATYSSASTAQRAEMDEYVKTGLRQFYWPSAITGRMHRWSFLSPTATITLWPTMTEICTGTTTVTSSDTDDLSFYATMIGKSLVAAGGSSYTISAVTSTSVCTVTSTIAADSGTAFTITADGDYRLPDDFASLEHSFRFADSSGYPPPQLVGEAFIRQRRVESDSTGTPLYVAVRPQSTTNLAGQRFELCVYPIPSTTYTLTYRYNVLPNALVNTTNEYPYGGAAHSETIRESVLAAAEAGANDTQNIHRAMFLERLKVSLDADLILSTPARLKTGYPEEPYRAQRGNIVATYDNTAP